MPTKIDTPVRRAAADRKAGAQWFPKLDTDQRWEVGDALVLGTFDWWDWGFDRPPSRAFLDGLDDERMGWES